MPENKKLVNRWEVFFLLVVFLILLITILGKFDIHMVEKTEDTQLLDHPHQ